MISFELGVEDLADTRFAVSPLSETVLSLRVLHDPGLSAVHLPWRRSVLGALGGLDTGLLMSLVAVRLTLPDFLTPRPTVFDPSFEDELALARRTPPALVRRDLLAAHARAVLRSRWAPRRTVTTRPWPPCATGSALSCGGTGRSPSSRCGRRCGSWSRRT
ncbi:hypothetical protein [Streptomyces cirratus]|uniref:hypothetical protein n=1 Tax=Streptomyces cirratus TaxID=68187 RepID=UPI003621EE9B